MSRAWSLALPLVTVLVVTYAVLIAGAPRTVLGARVYGGPTEGASRLSLRVIALQREGERETPIWNGPLSVRVTAAGSPTVTVSVARARHGVAELLVPLQRPAQGPVRLELRDGSGTLLARGDVGLDLASWAKRARRRGGWIRGRGDGKLVLSIAPGRGAFVVGAKDPLWIRVERSGVPAPGVTLTVSADGAHVSPPAALISDARGEARLDLEPVELNPSVRVEARSANGETGLIDSGLPVVPGGFHVQRTATGVRIECAAPREEAFFSVVSERARSAGGVVALTANARGGCVGDAELPQLTAPSWFVVSSELDLNSAATIGWPLQEGLEPAHTFDVADALLLDGLPAAFEREQTRRSRVRWLSAGFIALAFALSVVQLVARVRAADRDISRHLRQGLEPAVAARVAPGRWLWLLAGLFALGLGFLALGIVLLARPS